MSKLIAIVTARGGSKRIPQKNIKEFCGKPIIAYSIEAALKSNLFNEVMVSTDSEEIKDIAIYYGAKVPFMRSMKNASDTAATHEVILEVIKKYQDLGQIFEGICCIYPTAPFVTSDKLKNAYSLFNQKEVQGVYPVIPFSFPPKRGVVIRDGYAKFLYPENEFVRSQDLEVIYHDCGQFYFLKTKELLQQNKLVLNNMVPMIVSELEAQDIDNEDDWKIAELKYKYMIESK